MCFSKERINVTCMYILNCQGNHIVFLVTSKMEAPRFGRLFIRWLLSFALACFVVVVWCCLCVTVVMLLDGGGLRLKIFAPPLEWIEASLERLLEIVRFSLINIHNFK